MAIAHRSTAATPTITSTAGTLNITPATSPTLSGSTLILCISARKTSMTINTPTDTGSNTWVKITAASQDVNPQYLEMWWCKNAAAVTQVTANFSLSCAAAISLTEVTGMGASPTVDITKTGAGSSTAPATGTSSATTNAAEFAMAMAGWLNSSTMTFPGGAWTNTAQANGVITSNAISIGVASQVLSNTGTQSFSGSGITSANWYAALATFAPTSGVNTGAGFLAMM